MMFKGRHFDPSVILLCVRWYLAYGLSLRNLEEMMAERGIEVDHATIHRWTIHYAPLLLEQFNRRKRPVTGRWHVDETYIKVRGQWPVSLSRDRQQRGYGRILVQRAAQLDGCKALLSQSPQAAWPT
jgi:transposase-like protein